MRTFEYKKGTNGSKYIVLTPLEIFLDLYMSIYWSFFLPLRIHYSGKLARYIDRKCGPSQLRYVELQLESLRNQKQEKFDYLHSIISFQKNEIERLKGLINK